MTSSSFRFFARVGFILACLGCSAAMAAKNESARQARQGNVFGVNLGWNTGDSTVATVRMLGLARNLVGEWGYLRHGISPDANVEACKRSVAMIRAHHLIFVAGGAYPDKQFCEQGKDYPKLDADGTMRTAAQAKARLWRQMYEAKIPFYAVEVMNEVNIGDGWPPEKYAQWLYDLAVELKGAYPGLKICSCGMAGSGAEYYDKMLQFKPELKNVVDFWGLHPYPANHPPEYRPEGVSLRCYEETVAVLAKYGVDPIRLMCTETGYELELGDTGKDNAYPPIKEDNRAEYMPRAFRDYYVPDQRVEMVAPFMLWDLPWHGWDGWVFMYHDGRPRPIYNSVAAAPKPQGKDWLPTGDGRIAGRITWGDTGIGIPRVIVYTEPGFYGAVTGDTGGFEITGVPDGEYRVQAFADGFTDVTPLLVTVRGSQPARFDGRMERVSLVPHNFGEPGQPPPGNRPGGWSPLHGSKDWGMCRLDDSVRFDAVPTLRVQLAGGGEFGLWQYGGYNSAYPNEVQVAELLVRAEQAKVEPGGGPWLELNLTSGRGEILGSARAVDPDFKPDGKWHRITAALLGPARTSRVRLTFGIGKAAGTFWVSAPFTGEADFPLPADAQYKTTGYVPPLYEQNKRFFAQAVVDVKERNPSLETVAVTGQVTDFRGRPLPRAAVATDSPLFVAAADEDGLYKLTAPAGKEMRIRAFALGETPAVSRPIQFNAGQDLKLDLQTAPPTANPTLVNGGFNTFSSKEAGLMTGWTSFGATDGTTASGKTIFEAKSYEGEGLYFAQSGSNTKNGGAYQIIEAQPGRKYRLTGMVYTRTEGGGKKPLDNNCRIGLDPTGGRDPDSPDVIWTAPTESDQKWTKLAVEAAAKTVRVSVFVRHEMRRANTWNLTLFDDLRLEEVE